MQSWKKKLRSVPIQIKLCHQWPHLHYRNNGLNWVQEFSSKSRGKKTWRSIFIFLSYKFSATPVPRKLRFAIVSQKITAAIGTKGPTDRPASGWEHCGGKRAQDDWRKQLREESRWEEGEEEEDLRKKEGLKQGCLKKTAQKPNKTKSKEPCRTVFQSKLRRKGSLDKTYPLDPTPPFLFIFFWFFFLNKN